MNLDAILVQIRASYIHIDLRGVEPQLGQYYIAEYAHKNGFEVKVKSYSSNDAILASLEELLTAYQCKIIGFYLDSENQWIVRKITCGLKERFEQVKVVIGGPQVTGDPTLAMKRIPFADYAIEGEGERPFSELLSNIQTDNPNISEINGLLYREKDNIIKNQPQKQIFDLDFYPWPKRYNYTLDKNVVFDQLSTGRGCVGHCAFCFEGNKKGNLLRIRSVKSVIEEIDYLISNLKGHRYLSFLDDTFILNKNRTTEICTHLINKYGGEVGWFCEGRVDILRKNLDLLPLIKKAGNIRIQLGGESGNQKILDSYQKNMNLEDVEAVVAEIYKSGIPSIYINFIIGGAHETIESFNDTLEFAKNLLNIAPGCAEVGCSLLTPYVGTPIRKNPSAYDIEIVDSNLLSGPDGFIPFCKTRELSIAKIHQLKALFDSEILKEHLRIVKLLTNDQLLSHYNLREKYEMYTNWLICSNEIESYKNYFESQTKFGYVQFASIEKSRDLSMAVPYRTVQPISDGVQFYAQIDDVDKMRLDGLELDIFLLSSGKLSHFEIESLVKAKYAEIPNVEDAVNKVYSKFDRDRLVIWKLIY